MMENYEDIIHLPHHVSGTHPPMPAASRAAQFAPFAALSGFEDAVRETARLTEEKRELDEDARNRLDEKLRMLQDKIKDKQEVEITYFRPDGKKEGGAYATVKGYLKKADIYGRKLVMHDGTRIDAGDILEISIN